MSAMASARLVGGVAARLTGAGAASAEGAGDLAAVDGVVGATDALAGAGVAAATGAAAFDAALDSAAAEGTACPKTVWGTNPDNVRTKRRVLVFFMAGLALYGDLTG